MIFIATTTASPGINTGRTACFVGVLLLVVHLIFARTLCLRPLRAP